MKIAIRLRSYIKGAAPQEVFAALSDRQGLKSLMPRMQKIEFLGGSDNSETVVMHIGIGGGFGTIRCEGTLGWVEGREVTFNVKYPLPVEVRWVMSQAVKGTDMDITLELDLEPMLGKMARFVPRQMVEEIMVKEMKHAMGQMPARINELRARERAVAA